MTINSKKDNALFTTVPLKALSSQVLIRYQSLCSFKTNLFSFAVFGECDLFVNISGVEVSLFQGTKSWSGRGNMPYLKGTYIHGHRRVLSLVLNILGKTSSHQWRFSSLQECILWGKFVLKLFNYIIHRQG